MRVWALVLALGGCGFSSSGTSSQRPDAGLPTDDAPPVGEGSGSSSGQTEPIHVCLGGLVQVCADAPRGTLSLTGTINTADASAASRCLPATAYTAVPAIDACVIAAQTIELPSGNTVAVSGSKRLIVLAAETLTIAGTLDAASHRGNNAKSGPAADTGPCPDPARNPSTSSEGGGGWGGTFGGPGNNGGNTPGGGIGGQAGAAIPITALGGGCPGGKGANNAAGNGGGNGGRGGGAVLLIAGQSLTIAGSGTVNASGAGGDGGRGRGGGGGGGAGGMIVLDAPTVTITGKCFANGGGGGEGASGLVDGASGDESDAPDRIGRGGDSISNGGGGGDGGFRGSGSRGGNSGGTAAGDPGAGGAGGGGVGILRIRSDNPVDTKDNKKVSPAPT